MNMAESGRMKMNYGMSLITGYFEEKMSLVININENVEQGTGLSPHFFSGNA